MKLRNFLYCSIIPALLCSCVTGGVHTNAIDSPNTSDEEYVDLELLSFASRASSSHNAQPWQFTWIPPDVLELSADTTRYLPMVDPTNRETFLSFGTMIETVEHAGTALGYEMQTEITVQTLKDTTIARFHINRNGKARNSKTLHVIESAYTPKGPLGIETIDGTILRAVGLATDYSDKEFYRYYIPRSDPQFTWIQDNAPKASLQQAWRDDVQRELSDYIAFSKREARETGIGITLEMMEIPWIARGFMRLFMNRESVMSKSFRNSIEGITSDQLEQCSGVVIITSDDVSPASLIQAGRVYQRLVYDCFERGIGVHPVSQLIEEAPWNDRLRSDWAPNIRFSSFCASVGYKRLFPILR